MCGIFYYLSTDGINNHQDVLSAFMKIKHRGPDNTSVYLEDKMLFGFHRLAINDLSMYGNQPMFKDETLLMCNGEIYNDKDLIKRFNLNCTSGSDCEVILKLYLSFKEKWHDKYSIITKLCENLEGEFSFILYDKTLNTVYAARDRYGMRPLFIGYDNTKKTLGFASELKAIDHLFENVQQFIPSYCMTINISSMNTLDFDIINACHLMTYNNISTPYDSAEEDEERIFSNIKFLLETSVKERCTSDVPICALLSGGLDSSLVCGILAKKYKSKLNTFSIGMLGSPDLEYANKVARYIGSNHHEIIVTPREMLDVIEDVIKIIESYDITSVRASIPNYLIAKYIKENTDFKVVFSGEMSDEVFSGYVYNKNSPSPDELHKESCRLLQNICYFDSLRADRCISSQGLELRLPFSNTKLIKYVQSIDPKLRMSNDKIEKYILRHAFEGSNTVPVDVLWRPKAAFSDAVSNKEDSWHLILQRDINIMISDEEFNQNAHNFKHNMPKTKEAYYYRKIFNKYYKHDEVIPYFWMPRWTNVSDPSARELGEICKE